MKETANYENIYIYIYLRVCVWTLFNLDCYGLRSLLGFTHSKKKLKKILGFTILLRLVYLLVSTIIPILSQPIKENYTYCIHLLIPPSMQQSLSIS